MRQLLTQDLGYLRIKNRGKKENNYFMITSWKGCCKFGGGKIEFSLE